MEPSTTCEQLAQAVGPQVRSRVTVVCAECKRLKLKCDRRAPCGSCTKRDTVARCIYSPAAAEKVDLHSLNNRLIAVESQLAQITAPGTRFPPSSSCAALPSAFPQTVNSYHSHDFLSSSMDDITAIWMEEIDIPQQLTVRSGTIDYSEGYIKSEPSPHALPPSSSSSHPTATLPLPLLLPPISYYYAPHPSTTSPPLFTKSLLSHLPFAPRRRMRLYEHAEEALRMMPGPCFSWRVWRERAEGIWKWVESEGTPFLTNEYSEDLSRPSTSTSAATSSSRTCTEMSKADTARTIFFGTPPTPPPTCSSSSSQKTPPFAHTTTQMAGRTIGPSLPFFASVAGALALALVVEDGTASASAALYNCSSSPSHLGGPGEPTGAERNIIHSSDRTCIGPGPKKSRKDPSPKENLTSPALLHALSRQALGVWEGEVASCSSSGSTSTSYCATPASEHDLDYISAVILGVLFVLLHEKRCPAGSGSADSLASRGGAVFNVKEGWILGEIGKLVNIARMMGLDVDPDLTPGRYGLYESEARRRAWWDVWWWDVYTSTLTSRAPLIPLHASSTRLPLDVDEEVFTFACTSAPLLSPTGKEGVGRWFGMRVRLAQLVKDTNSRTSLLSSLENPSLSLSLENAAQCEAEIKQWLSDLPPAFRMEGEGTGEESSMSVPSTNSSTHGSTPPILLAQRLDILMTAHRLAMGLYLPFLRPHSSSSSQSLSTCDSQTNVKPNVSPQMHQARVGALTAAHGLIRAGKHFVELAWARPDLMRRRDGLGLSLCCGLVFDAHSGFGQGVDIGYSKALFDACVICATSVLRDPGAVWVRTAVEDAKTGLALLRDLCELSLGLDVSVVEALVCKLDSGASGAGRKRKRDGWDDGDGRNAVAAPTGSHGEEGISFVPVSGRVAGHAIKLPSPPLVNATPNTGAKNKSSIHDPSKDKSGSEPKRTCYPAVGFRVRHGKEPSPLARGRTVSVESHGGQAVTTRTTQGMSGQRISQLIAVPQLSVMPRSASIVPPLQPPSLVSTPTSMSQDGGVDFRATYETQSQSQCGQKFPSYDYAASSASPFSYPDTPQYAQFNSCSVPPSTPTSFAPPQLPPYSGTAPQSQPSFPAQTPASQYSLSQAPYGEHHLPPEQWYSGEQQGYAEQTWTQASDGAYWRSYEHSAQSQLRYQE